MDFKELWSLIHFGGVSAYWIGPWNELAVNTNPVSYFPWSTCWKTIWLINFMLIAVYVHSLMTRAHTAFLKRKSVCLNRLAKKEEEAMEVPLFTSGPVLTLSCIGWNMFFLWNIEGGLHIALPVSKIFQKIWQALGAIEYCRLTEIKTLFIGIRVDMWCGTKINGHCILLLGYH